MLTFLQKQFLPVGLVFVALVGLSIPEPGIYMATLPTQYVAVSIIFFVSGLLLRTDEIRAAASAWPAMRLTEMRPPENTSKVEIIFASNTGLM